jgi:hypothetical protein
MGPVILDFRRSSTQDQNLLKSTKLLRQANVIHTHSITIAPKHDHSNTTNYVWDQLFLISDISSLLFEAVTFLNVVSNRKGNKPYNHQSLVVLTKVSQAINQVQATHRLQDQQDSSQPASRITSDLLHRWVQSQDLVTVNPICRDLLLL